MECIFLSCLFGSEQQEQHMSYPRQFLSCLFGSELERGARK